MLGGIISMVIAVWFYKTAESKQLPKLQWAFVGFLAYYLPNLLWTFMIAKPMVVSYHAQNKGLAATLMGGSGILIGLACVVLLWMLVLNKLKQPE